MKTAYIFVSPTAGLHFLKHSILPELESGTHNFNVVAMCFFGKNAMAVSLDNELGQRLARLAKERDIILMTGENVQKSAQKLFRQPTDCVVTTISDGQEIGCFPDFYSAVGDHKPDRFISL